MSGEIRARASRRRRPIGAQIVHLLTVGLLNDPEELIHGHRGTSAHANSQLLTGKEVDTHFPAQPRTASHGKSRRQEEAG